MKIKNFLLLSVLLIISSCIFGGSDVEPAPSQSIYKAITMKRQVLNNSISTMTIQQMKKSGKIYTFDQLFFINDVNKGFHVYNYFDAQNPQALHFLNVPGATDLALRDGFLYINQATDLVTLWFDHLTNQYQVLHRNENVFPQKQSPDGFNFNVASDEIIIDFELK